MQELIKIIKKMKNVLTSLEVLLNEEHENLLKHNSDIHLLNIILQKKVLSFKNFSILSKKKLLLETKYNILSPYIDHKELKKYWDHIISQCLLLRELNLKNKTILNKKIYLNQKFLESFSSYKNCVTYNVHGELKI